VFRPLQELPGEERVFIRTPRPEIGPVPREMIRERRRISPSGCARGGGWRRAAPRFFLVTPGEAVFPEPQKKEKARRGRTKEEFKEAAQQSR